ncbi:unnamed protein product [Brassicogethes aeneus]|uniref:HSF-type DNA-binding domain-containing protein n=1 Tax=Brassicogethes aeneus TaxID=1431903 RepID=A0A9P0BGZ7_BRAAE|nr:unnamed protein product [Brassicogethes aeneus]
MSIEHNEMPQLGQNLGSVPAFLGKLWKMVNDPATDRYICWNKAGTSFVIQNKGQFWCELLPVYYKHNNMSSFVRQLNMYGFHKLSTVENGTMDIDKGETQFTHPLFRRNQPDLLNYIKRKVTTHKANENVNKQSYKEEDLLKVLTDVKQLKGRQSNVDAQLTSMKQENSVLWRELAMLRQKHMKQQQIVNKLIQFLVTMAHTNNSSRMGVGVKRRMPLMINESPLKKAQKQKKEAKDQEKGPTIHEIESQRLPEDIFDTDQPIVDSPASSCSQYLPSSPSMTGESPAHSTLDPAYLCDLTEPIGDLIGNDNDFFEAPTQQENNVFLNPGARDTLISNLTNGTYNFAAVNNAKNDKKVVETTNNNAKVNSPNMTVATRINNSTRGSNPSRDDLDLHLESSQTELDSLKDILSNCSSFDANTLLGLFNDDSPNYGIGNHEYEASHDGMQLEFHKLLELLTNFS